jgi:hypothetical protein
MARAEVEGRMLEKPVVATDDCMQAFLWRHLVPAQELRTCEYAGYRRLPFKEEAMPLVEIAPGGEADFEIPLVEVANSDRYSFKIGTGPKGLRINSAKYSGGLLNISFSGDEELSTAAQSGNIIVEVHFTQPPSPSPTVVD